MQGALLWDIQAERMVTVHLGGVLPHLGYATTWRGTYSRNSQIGRVSQRSARDPAAQSSFCHCYSLSEHSGGCRWKSCAYQHRELALTLPHTWPSGPVRAAEPPTCSPETPTRMICSQHMTTHLVHRISVSPHPVVSTAQQES